MEKFYGIVMLLLLLLTHEVMVHTEARNCYSRSRAYHGRCFFKNHRINCKAMCKEEKFTTGRCIRGTCYCTKPCAGGGGGGGTTPAHHAHPPPHPPPPSDGNGEEDGGKEPPANGGGGTGSGEADGGDAPPSLK